MPQPTSQFEAEPGAIAKLKADDPSGLKLRIVRNRGDLKEFIELPNRLHHKEPFFVAPLRFDVKRRLDRKANPFFQHSEAEYFIVQRGKTTLGRIAAIDYRRHNEVHGEKTGFFGWFDCVNDQAVANLLFEAAAAWLKERGLESIRGPVSFSLNDEAGVLVEGFEVEPMLLTPWNPPYYEGLMTTWGMSKLMDLISFLLPVNSFEHERIGRIVERVKKRGNLALRPFDMKRFAAEVDHFKELYNDAWHDNWGFVGLTDAEIDHMAKDLKPVVEPTLANFVEIDGKPVGFALVLPDVNHILKGLRGRLFPFGIFKLLFGLKRIPNIRLVAMGVRRDLHGSGIDSMLYYASFDAARKLGKRDSELGWVLETNSVMITTIEKVGGRRYRNHRILERSFKA